MMKTLLKFTTLLLVLTASVPASAQETADYLVNWAPNPEVDIVGYVIFRSTASNGVFDAIDSVGPVTHGYIDTGLAKGTRYFYKLKAKNASNQYSSFSALVSGVMIPDDADENTHNMCRITGIEDIGSGLFEINWTTLDATIGFVQYDRDETLDSMSTWDDSQYGTSHVSQVGPLLLPGTYGIRAVAYDENRNMTISALASIEVSGEDPVAPTAPQELIIYPIPYNPNMDNLSMSGLPADGSVSIYNERGQEVWQRRVGSTSTSLDWDGRNGQNSSVSSGVYYVVIKDSGGGVISKKPIMVVH